MMLAIILLYCLSWFPIKSLQFLLLNDLISSCSEWEYYRLIALYISAHWLTTASGLINPIVYSLMSDNFKVSQQE